MATAASANTMLVKLQPNIPEVFELAFAEGKRIESRIVGRDDSLLFSFTDGRRAFWPLIVGEKLRAAGIGARKPFQIVMRQRGREIEYEISTPNTQTETRGAGTVLAAPAGAAAPASFGANAGTTLGITRSHHTAPGQSVSDRLTAAFLVALDVANRVQDGFDARGFNLNFITEERIAQIAITAFIQSEKAAS